MLRTFQDRDAREILPRVFDYQTAISIDNNLVKERTGEKTCNNVVIERFAAKVSIILSRDPFTVMPHRNDSNYSWLLFQQRTPIAVKSGIYLSSLDEE